MKRKHKTYSRPKRPFDKARLDEEALIKKEFGLKNKKELWKTEAKIKSMREKAKKLISADAKEQQALFDRLQKIGLDVNSIADVLALDKKDLLSRRLQSVVVNKKLAPTSKTARQMIVHKKILVDGKAVNVPSYIVPVALESSISVKPKVKSPKASSVSEAEGQPKAEVSAVAEGESQPEAESESAKAEEKNPEESK